VLVGVYKPGMKSESLRLNVGKTQDKFDRVIINFCGLPSVTRIPPKSSKDHLGFGWQGMESQGMVLQTHLRVQMKNIFFSL